MLCLNNLKSDRLLGTIIILANVKTNKRVIIPLANDLAGILERYRDKIRPEKEDRLFPWTYNAARLRFERL
jgi:integrase